MTANGLGKDLHFPQGHFLTVNLLLRYQGLLNLADHFSDIIATNLNNAQVTILLSVFPSRCRLVKSRITFCLECQNVYSPVNILLLL